MPFPLLQSILGVTFAVVWLFIAYVYFSDKLGEARARRVPHPTLRPHIDTAPRKRRTRRRIHGAGASN